MSLAWQRPLTRGALLLMESLWVYALVAFAVAVVTDGGNPSLFGVIAVVFGSFVISRFLQQTDLSLGLLRAWGTGVSLIVFYAIVRIDFFGDARLWDFTWADALFNHTTRAVNGNGGAVIGIPLLWAFWLRGVLRGQENTDFDDVVGSFAIGVGVVAVVELLATRTDAPALVGYIAVPYITIGLLAIALTHAARGDEEYARSFTSTWVIAVAGAVLLIALVALAFALIDFSTAAAAISAVGSAAGWVLAKAAYAILWPFVTLAVLIGQALHWFFVSVLGVETQNPQTIQPPVEPAADESQTKDVPGWIILIAKLVVATPVVALILFGAWFVFTRFQRRVRPGETKESAYQEGRLAADLGNLLGSLLGRLRPNLHLGGDQLDPARRLYFDMLAAGEQRGVARRPPETPLELSPRLSESFRADTPAGITSVFDDVRYGGLPPPEPELRRLREEWDQARRG